MNLNPSTNLGAAGWELTSTLLQPGENGADMVMVFKRPK
jgi:hypothetical protein